MLFTHLAKTAHFCSLMDWFLTSWTLKITSLLNLNENQCWHHLDLSMIKGFHGFIMFSLSYSKIGWICSKMPRKLWKRCWPENVHIVSTANKGCQFSAFDRPYLSCNDHRDRLVFQGIFFTVISEKFFWAILNLFSWNLNTFTKLTE